MDKSIVNKQVVKDEAIRLAARLAMGDCLSEILSRCEDQKTVSARVVERDLEDVQEFMRVCAIQMRTMHDLIS